MIHYENDINALENELHEKKKQSKFYSTIRLCLMILVFVFLYLGEHNRLFYILSILLLFGFLCMVYVHEKLKKKIEFIQEKLVVIEKLRRRKSDEWKKDTYELEETEDSVALDLDILGKGSLFHYLNMAHTPYGKDYVKSLLIEQSNDKKAIIKRQYAVRELLSNTSFLLSAQTYSSLFLKHSRKIKRNIFDELVCYAKEAEQRSKTIYYIANFLRLLTILAFLLFFTGYLPLELLFIMFSINMITTLCYFAKVDQSFKYLNDLKSIVEDYQDIIDHLCLYQSQDVYLQELQKEVTAAKEGIHQLLNITTIASCRANVLTYLFLNSLFLIDIYCDKKLHYWKLAYGIHLEHWFHTIAKFEGLCSLSVIGQVKEVYCYPDIDEQIVPEIRFHNIKHPLIQEDRAIANSVDLTAETYIITGSNMSGKTTFLRSIGVNAILCFCGAPVCSEQFHTSLFQIYTSMRVSDDVNEGISTFYAELLRIKNMMVAAKEKQPMMVLIDEIFKGTNSADRVLCAKRAIEELHLPFIITLVSTHDFELCALDKDKAIQAKNYHFEEYYTDDEIHFDYRLKEGKCTTTNASQLMRLAGF